MKKNINLIITAAGMSQRYGVENKLFAPCKNSCVVVEAIKPFLHFEQISRIIVAIHPSYSDELLNSLDNANIDDNRIIVANGGNSRTQTVKNALRAIEDDCAYIMIHDGARPFVTQKTIQNVIDGAIECGASLPLLKLTDALVCVKDGVSSVDRADYRRVQTPVCVEKNRLLTAYSQCDCDFYDDIGVVQKYAHGDVKAVDGDKNNVKITTKDDLKTNLYGIGYDIHRFKVGNGIKLLGTLIPCEFAFVAHSDGDVAVHAIMDAILSAIGEKDIGHLFPVDDSKYDDADSIDLLKTVLKLANDKGYALVNISVAIIAERPMLAPYVDLMRNNMSSVLGIPCKHIGITATTNEQVGDLGDCKSIACFATALLCQSTLD